MSVPIGYPKRPVLIDIENGFVLSAGSFKVNVGNVVRVSGPRLQALFNPTSLRLKHEQERAAQAAEVLSNEEFVAGQLKHYGIKFPRTGKLGAIRDILRRAVEQGKCDRVPPSVRQIEEAMRRDIKPLDEEWEAKIESWGIKAEASEEDDLPAQLTYRGPSCNYNNWQEDSFARCTTASEIAQCDVERFLEFYFLTDGKPDENKTHLPLALYGYDLMGPLYMRAQRIRGLSGLIGFDGVSQVLCVGWDYWAVLALSKSIGKMSKQDIKNRQQKGRQHFGTLLAPHALPLNLEQLIGSYVIQLRSLSEHWDMADTFTLDIASGYGRLFYKIRGRERGEDVIFSRPEIGRIDILDHECTKFVGKAKSVPHTGSNMEFWGHKVSHEPNKHIQPWGAFSEKAYEFERRDRWRRR
ncbi:hypothetical protein Neosp_009281 [[Neocosmospora] mangrovei]